MWKESVKLAFSKITSHYRVDANGFGGTHQANYSLWVQEPKKTSVLSALGAESMGKGKACYDIQHISILDRSERT
ncbi:hypothetical protein DY000_02033204 [Brassica cretica]|uniref:Neprosin domain-containing protein n=1 Tax=Brassica cretica TaxID=69181 RepID=A0ABQ7DQI7_BRACR|nr:hypothetical protein DY000_02033204 [Brassica cretica]